MGGFTVLQEPVLVQQALDGSPPLPVPQELPVCCRPSRPPSSSQQIFATAALSLRSICLLRSFSTAFPQALGAATRSFQSALVGVADMERWPCSCCQASRWHPSRAAPRRYLRARWQRMRSATKGGRDARGPARSALECQRERRHSDIVIDKVRPEFHVDVQPRLPRQSQMRSMSESDSVG